MMTVEQCISAAAGLAAMALMIYQLVRLREFPEGKAETKRYFRRFSGLVLIMSVLQLLNIGMDVSLGGVTWEDFGSLSGEEASAWLSTQMAMLFFDIFLSTVFLYIWITFLSWYLFEDRDFIRRRFWIGFAPLAISAAAAVLCIPVAMLSKAGFWFFIAALAAAFAVRVFYFFISLWLLGTYKKQNGYLRFFNPWAYFLPVAVSWLFQDIFGLAIGTLGSALGVFFLFLSIVGEERYMDAGTRFYNDDFVGFLAKLAAKKQYAPHSAMTFTIESAEDMTEFAGILRSQLPEDCEPILRGGRKVVVLTKVTSRALLAMVMGDVQEEYRVTASAALRKKDETAGEFMERVL